MASKNQKNRQLNQLQPKIYQIYGIFNFKTEKLVFISLDKDEVEFEFDVQEFGEDYDIISLSIMVV